MTDLELINKALHGIASQAILDATLAAQNKVPLNDSSIQERINETLAIIVAEKHEIPPT